MESEKRLAMRRVVSIFISMFFSSIAHAELTIAIWQQNKQLWTTHIAGIGTGLQWANTAMEQAGQNPLYCPPGKLGLTVENDQSILEDTIKRHPKLEKTTPIGLLLLIGYRETFPCG